MQTVLRADNIKVQFGGLVAVNDVSLALNQGQILGLIGPNGAGKSTLFNAITGFAPIAAGRVTFMEHDVTRLPPYVRTRLRSEQHTSELQSRDNLLCRLLQDDNTTV